MTSKAIILGFVSAFSLTSCMTTMRGSVAMKTSDTEAHVCLGKGEVEPGDRVSLYRNDCPNLAGKKVGENACRKVKIGEGTVKEVLNDHYSVITLPPGIEFKEGTIVEKSRR